MASDLYLSCSLSPVAYTFLVNRDSVFSLLLVSPANPGAHRTLWLAQLNKHSCAGKLKEQPRATGRLTSVIPVVGELATVSEWPMGLKCPPNIKSLCFFSPKTVKNKKSSIIWYTAYIYVHIFLILILCRKRQTRNLDILLKFVVTGFDLYKILDDYGYSYAVVTWTVSS